MKGILLLSAGSKVAITRIARESARRRGLVLHASDRQRDVPARFEADQFAVFPDLDRKEWIEDTLSYCQRHEIGLVIPTRHGELATLAEARDRFDDAGICMSLSGPQTLTLCLHKLETYAFLQSIGAPTPATTTVADLATSFLSDKFPLFAKPATGAASIGARIVSSSADLVALPTDWLLQSVARGDEYTVNLYLDQRGRPLCAIPHQRLVTEAGEVVQARTCKNPQIVEEAMRIASRLPDARGILTLQCFYDESQEHLQIIEINPRIGGGFPLTHQAKGAYIEWLCQELIDGDALRPFESWTDQLLMLRYREAHFEVQANPARVGPECQKLH